jgi:hypothetical protein
MKTLIQSCVYFGGIALFLSCNTGEGRRDKAEQDTVLFSKLVLDWNTAHNTRDSLAFDRQYDDTVYFYGATEGKSRCLAEKNALFRKYPAFSQEITGKIVLEPLGPGECKCSFGKKVRLKESILSYPAYLIFYQVKGVWKIHTESDQATDRYLEKRKDGSLESRSERQ